MEVCGIISNGDSQILVGKSNSKSNDKSYSLYRFGSPVVKEASHAWCWGLVRQHITVGEGIIIPESSSEKSGTTWLVEDSLPFSTFWPT